MEEASFAVFIVGAAIWFGAVAVTAWIGARVRARGDAAAGVAWARRHARISRFVAVPAALLALAGGVWAVQLRDLAIDPHWWIGTGLGVWAVAFLGSTLPRGTLLARAVQRAEALGAEEEDVRWQVRQVTLVVRGELLLLTVGLVVIALMPVG